MGWLVPRTLVSFGDGKLVRHCTNTAKGEELQLGEGASAAGKSQVVVSDRGDTRLLSVGHEDCRIQVSRK